MNLTQNDRLKQVTSDTLIVGVDVGSQTHFCRAFDWRGFELSRRVFKFSNTGMGFLTFLRWTEELMNKTEMKKVIVGCEPTGCYWLTFQKFLQDHDVQLVTVNPFTVNRSMELDDNSPEKSDLKDPKTIALLVKDGRFSTSYLPSGVYAEIREASVCRDQIMKQHVRLSNQIQGWLQKFFPEYFECYADWDSTSGLMLLREAPLPQDILKIGAGGINQIWRDAKVRAAGIKRAQTLVEAAQNSVGLEAGEAARLEIWVLVNDYILKAEQLKRLDEYLEEKVKELLADAQVEESRIAAEVILFADKICTDEEVVRLKSHIAHMRNTLEESEGIGRKLDFIAQEMNREANTILSKANDLEVSNYAIGLKTEIEKIREQIQNIE